MTNSELKKKAGKLLGILEKEYPDAKCSLNFESPLELLVATILSAQCTDERVNIVTKDLFKKYRKAKDFADAELVELEKDIHSTGFFKNKAKSIKSCCEAIVSEHGGKVPGTLDELVKLHGVGRKTANVVLGNAFGVPGITVDTHVGRVAQRLGLTNNTDAVKIEFDLMALLPEKSWTDACHRIILHGRAICGSRAPKCDECALLNYCDYGLKRQEDG